MSGTALSAADVGFEEQQDRWTAVVRGQHLAFRHLQGPSDLRAAEALQQEVMGVSDRDLQSAGLMACIPMTGGHILGATEGDRLIGYVAGYGGYVDGTPLLLSDLMVVHPASRGGVGSALKSLQAVVARRGGFPRIRWTVDPLRSLNARLNFHRLGATAMTYLTDAYGEGYASGLYGGLPTDRLVVDWDIASQRVSDRLRGRPILPPTGPVHRIPVPIDIDAVVASDRARAMRWRHDLRHQLVTAFSRGLTICGFDGTSASPTGAYLLRPARCLAEEAG